MDKRAQRTELRRLRDAIPPELRRRKSRIIAESLIKSPEYLSAGTVFVYLSVGSEAETSEIVRRAFADGKNVAVPVCDTAERTMVPYMIGSADELCAGAYGIPEPRRSLIESGRVRSLKAADIDLAVVPGLGFDRSGYRIGYGGGYYDRFLEKYEGCSAGLCFSECLTAEVCRSEHDMRVDRIFTDTGICEAE